MIDHFLTIEHSVTAEFRDRGSKFIAYAFPVTGIAGFKSQLATLRKAHPKAAHHCFAYRIGTDGNTFRSADDGEPSGSAGRPILGQIDNRQLTDTAVVVVRYFGGTLLGVPGLINAYKTTTAMALDQATVVSRPVLGFIRLEFDYTLMNEVMRIQRQFEGVIRKQEALLFCTMEMGIPIRKLPEAVEKLRQIRGVQVAAEGNGGE